MIQQIAAGIYAYSPLAQRSLNKIRNIIREEMDSVGGQEIGLPALQPLETWRHSGRDESFGSDLLRLEDRRGRPMVLAPTHEETVTLFVKPFVQSYRDLPLLLYQIQTKFRDEPRPRAGLIRVREFDMKDAYSFDTDVQGLENNYQAVISAYKKIFSRCGLPVVLVEADSGAIGGKDSQEFILPNIVGEDTIIQCSGCGYAANMEQAVSTKELLIAREEEPVSEIHTPEVTTIEALTRFLSVPKSRILKSVFYWANGELLFVVIRGDLAVNETKLKRVVGSPSLRLATDKEVVDSGLVPGFASPIGSHGFKVIADDSVESGSNFIAGANKKDFHFRNVNFPRDYSAYVIRDISITEEGQKCRFCDNTLSSTRGIEVGHVFKLGTWFTEAFQVNFVSKDGERKPPVMGCYGIGVGRLLAAAIEQNHDDKGMCFPLEVAPFHIYLAVLNQEDPAVDDAAQNLYEELLKNGIETVLDDREESPGVKLNDADLLGFPLRIILSRRTLKENSVEIKMRTSQSNDLVSLEETLSVVTNLLYRSRKF
jgi:prolyl-tRNA synthetase